MQIGNIIIHPWNRKNFIPRVVALALVFSWLVWGLVIHVERQRLKERLEQQQQEQLLREEQQRREAAYQRRLLEEQNARRGVRNIMDGYKK